jgi:hypothetical protein
LNYDYDGSYNGGTPFIKVIWIRPDYYTLIITTSYPLEYEEFKKLFKEEKEALALP